MLRAVSRVGSQAERPQRNASRKGVRTPILTLLKGKDAKLSVRPVAPEPEETSREQRFQEVVSRQWARSRRLFSQCTESVPAVKTSWEANPTDQWSRQAFSSIFQAKRHSLAPMPPETNLQGVLVIRRPLNTLSDWKSPL